MVSDLVSLIEHVQSSLRLIERIIAREVTPGSPESSTSAIGLDDISPRYMKAATVVQACNVSPDIALHSLLNSDSNDSGASSLPALAVIRA